jgi:thiamine pyrophosphate-dependent acetolactate synthase large subunit-like protein
MTRHDATRIVVGAIAASPRTPVVASLGHPAYDLFAVDDRPANFYTWGSMGLASSIGLGLAMARPDLRVYVLDGDGSLLMNLGSLATIAWVAAPNLIVVVWDNASYGTTGGQDTATGHGADLAAAAHALGVPQTMTVRTPDELEAALQRAGATPGPWLIAAKVTESAPTAKPPQDGVFLKQRLMAAIGNPESGTLGSDL